MDEYVSASQRALEHQQGIWRPIRVSKKVDPFNRLRLTNWLLQLEYEVKEYIPIIGINYRWSDLFSFYKTPKFSASLSAETGTFVYFMLPYANLGAELRYNIFYVRGHYDALLPLLWFSDDDDIETHDFYGLDAGIQIPLSKHAGIELEYNFKGKDKFSVNLMSISFSAF
jgi:hypothetical protein